MNKEVLNRAPSNSPISIHQMSNKSYSKFQEEVSLKYGFIGLKLDKLSLTAEVSEEFHSEILSGNFILYLVTKGNSLMMKKRIGISSIPQLRLLR